MTDKKPTATNKTNGGGSEDMSVQGDDQDLRGLPITVHAQYLKDFSFECPNSPAVLINQRVVGAKTFDKD